MQFESSFPECAKLAMLALLYCLILEMSSKKLSVTSILIEFISTFEFLSKFIQLVSVSNLFPLKVVQNAYIVYYRKIRES